MRAKNSEKIPKYQKGANNDICYPILIQNIINNTSRLDRLPRARRTKYSIIRKSISTASEGVCKASSHASFGSQPRSMSELEASQVLCWDWSEMGQINPVMRSE